MAAKHSFTFPLSPEQQGVLQAYVRQANLKPTDVPYTTVAADGDGFRLCLYTSGKLVVQGKKAEEWVTFVLEPEILKEARVGYEDVLTPERFEPHMGIDESGKGDFFGPLVIAAVYVDEKIVQAFDRIGVRDSKTITSDAKAEKMAEAILGVVGNRHTVVEIGPRAYNRLYRKIGNVNRLLAWGHARAIENLLETVPGCPRALADQFGPKQRIERALMQKGKGIKLEQKTKAESDPAVAGASIIARARFIAGLRKLGKRYDITMPKGASEKVRETAVELVKQHGPKILPDTVKTHFRTTDQVLEAAGHDRSELPEEDGAS